MMQDAREGRQSGQVGHPKKIEDGVSRAVRTHAAAHTRTRTAMAGPPKVSSIKTGPVAKFVSEPGNGRIGSAFKLNCSYGRCDMRPSPVCSTAISKLCDRPLGRGLWEGGGYMGEKVV